MAETRPGTLCELLAHAVARGRAAGITDERGTMSWEALAARSEGYAGQLAQCGVGARGRVALWLPNSADYLALIFAVARLGAVAVHVNTRFRAHEVATVLRRAAPSVLVTDFAFQTVDFAAVLSEVPPDDRASLRAIVDRGGAARARSAAVPVLALAERGRTPDVARPELPCLTYTTSGTTSGPKLVLHDQRAIAGHAWDVMGRLRTDAPDAGYLAAVPLCGTFGNAAAMAAVAGGAHVVCMERFEPAAADALIRAHCVTHAVGADDMLGRLARTARDTPHDTMRFFGFAAFGPTAASAVTDALAAGLAPRGVYGSSELQALFAHTPDDWPLEAGGEPVSSRADFAIRDPQTGTEMPEGEAGELCVRAPSQFLSYLDDPDATARARTADGLFRTGDLCRRQGAGFVFHSRLGDALRLGGFLVDPEEIEAFLQTLPGVAAAQVVGVEREGVTRAVAFVRIADGVQFDEAAILRFCAERLARYKVPVRAAALAAFPMTDSPNGPKIQRVRLRELGAALLAAAPA